MVARAEFANDDVSVAPGTATSLELILANLGNRTETFTLVPSGLLAGWVRIDPPTVTLFGGSQETITVTLKPPQLSTTPAGPAPLTVHVHPPGRTRRCHHRRDHGQHRARSTIAGSTCCNR